MSALHVVFKLAESAYAVPAAEVLHMDSYTGATPVPGAPPYVAGLVQVRGQVLPVVDVRIRFGLPPIPPVLESRVMVVQHGGRTVGLLVDTAREVVKLESAQLQAPPEMVQRQARGFVKAVAQVGGRLLMLIDVEKTIGTEAVHGGEQRHDQL